MNSIATLGTVVDSISAPRSSRLRRAALIWSIWTAFGTLQAVTWLVSPNGDWYSNAGYLFGVALFNAYLWAAITPLVMRFATKVSGEREHRALWIAISLLVAFILSAVIAILASSVHGGLPWTQSSSGESRSRYSYVALSRWYFEELVLFSLTFGAGIALDMLRKYQAREREAMLLKEQATLLESERNELNARLAHARLAILRSQLNPHFLFNTLNAVSALVTKDPGGVRNIIALLSELLRFALSEAEEEEVSVKREIAQLRLYLEILEIRYQGQLQTAVIVEPAVQAALVPRMILQPLVENAMKHGLALTDGAKGMISVRAFVLGSRVILTVTDNGAGVSEALQTHGLGMGLRLTRERLRELYGADCDLKLVASSGGGTTARIEVPLRVTGGQHSASSSS
jgi:two-component system LytT family sensor kinase